MLDAMTDLNEACVCPGCGAATRSDEYRLEPQPVVQNYRFLSAAAAMAVARAEIRLTQCSTCGLVFNRVFESDAVPYDSCYDNQQTYSSAFREHLEQRAEELIRNYPLRGGAVLEVGCGKGDFLRLLCGRADALGVGYDTTYEGPPATEDRRVTFHRRYLRAAEVRQRFNAVICRHVIEHVPQPGRFLRELSAIAEAAGDPVVVIETPRFEWMVAGGCFWDVFYEHCNYFSDTTLALLCRKAGFRVLKQQAVFADQYQWLELRAHGNEFVKPAGVPAGADLAEFRRVAGRSRRSLAERVAEAAGDGAWAIWGAGAKGVALANQMPELRPSLVIDSNPGKQGGVVPGTEIPIVSPEDAAVLRMKAVLIVNPAYEAEITSVLRKQGFVERILVL
jgi:ubiquinone/menaquinone biosynthesis C-methylase UbiE/rubredoxin